MGIVAAWLAAAGAGLVLLVVVAWILAARHFARQLVKPRHPSLAETRQQAIEQGGVSPALFDLFTESVPIPTAQGYSLEAFVVSAERVRASAGAGSPAAPAGAPSSAGTIVFCHGHGWTWHGMLKYLEPFRDGRWNIVCYSSRGHGGNSRLPPGFGHFEAADLGDVLAWARRRFPEAATLALYGESMGASVILQALGRGLQADFAILDCPFADLGQVALHRIRRTGLPGCLARPIFWLARQLVWRIAGFDPRGIRPVQDIRGCRVPFLLLHGAKDRLVPVAMARAIKN